MFSLLLIIVIFSRAMTCAMFIILPIKNGEFIFSMFAYRLYPIKKIHIFILNQIQVLLQIQTEIDEGNSTWAYV